MRISEIKKEAKDSLKGNWGLAIGAILLNGLLTGAIMFIPILIMIIVLTFAIYTIPSIFTVVFVAILLIVVLLAAIYLLAMPLMIGLEWLFLNFIDDNKRFAKSKTDPTDYTEHLFRKRPEVGNLFDAFKKNYWKNVGTVALMSLFGGLWGGLFGAIDALAGILFGPTAQLVVSLITWIPLIIIILRYALVIPLLKDHPEYRAIEIIRESKRLMRGNIGKYFLLSLSFILWFIPGIFAYTVGLMMIAASAINQITFVAIHDPHAMALQNPGIMALAGILILIGFLYLIGINFYVMPYLRASYAAFYRRLKPLKIEDEEKDETEFIRDPDIQYGLN